MLYCTCILWGKLRITVNGLIRYDKTNFSSEYAAIEKAVQVALDDTIK